MAVSSDVTALLDAWNEGDNAALDQLLDIVYQELRHIAEHLLRNERSDHTLQPTAVVNELYLRLADQRRVSWHKRAEFFAVAARVMRRILVDHARRRMAVKRGSASTRLALDSDLGFPSQLAPDVLALNEALMDLERRSHRQTRIVEMRLVAGLTLEEIAAVENVSLSTVSREWRTARLFLLGQLRAS